MKPGNVILFPKWQKMLEEESVSAIKEKKFEEALEKLDKLLSYQVKNHEIFTGKLICLMELERYEEAQELCEMLIEVKDTHYYQYIHIYLTLLFQTNQYDQLIEMVQEELENGKVPSHLEEPFKQLFMMSEKMRLNAVSEQSGIYLEELFNAVHQENHLEQWRLINNLSKMNIIPDEKVTALLVNDYVHPLNKTAIYLWMKKQRVGEPIDIHKFGVQLKMIPNETPDISHSKLAEEVSRRIQEIEQVNSSLFQVMETLFEHYLYVLYPITPPVEDANYIAEALHTIANDYLNMQAPPVGNEIISKYVEEIKTTDVLYASIIDE